MARRVLLLLLALTVAQMACAAEPASPEAALGMPSDATIESLNRANFANTSELGVLVFQTTCVNCHGKPEFEKAPPLSALLQYTPERIYEALNSGPMAQVIGNRLNDPAKRAVSESITGQRLGAAAAGAAEAMPNRCASNPPLQQSRDRGAWNGWGIDANNRRFQDARNAGLVETDVPRLKLKWAFGLPGSTSAYGQPAVMFGRVFVGADSGYVYSLDARSGCVYWAFKAPHGVRNAMTIGAVKGPGATRYAVYFGDLKANVHAIDAQTGTLLWSRKVEDDPTTRITAAPTLHEGRLYVPVSSWEGFGAANLVNECCKARGAVAAYEAATGKFLWKTYSIPQAPAPRSKNSQGVMQWGPAGAPVWNSPTVDPKRHAVYFGTGDATTYPAPPTSDAVIAADMTTGKVLWSYQVHHGDSFLVGCQKPTENCPKVLGPDWDVPASPVLTTMADGKRRLIIGTKPGDILALDPDAAGALVWRKNVSGGPPVGDGPAVRGGPGIFWGYATDGDVSYFGLSSGGVAAVKLETGERLWMNPLDTASRERFMSASTGIPGVIFQGGSTGKLHALSTRDGHELWSFETQREFDTVNRVPAKGGSIMSAGAVVADGMVFVGSGYGVAGGTPGNVLLAFAPD